MIAVAALLLAAAVALVAALSVATCLTVPLVHSCQAAHGPPSNTGLDIRAYTYDSATVTGAIDPHGLETKYYIAYRREPAVSYDERTALTKLPRASGAQPVRVRLTGLAPVSRYDVKLVAENSAGSTQASDSFMTARVSPVRIDFSDVRASQKVITVGDPVSLLGHLSGAGGYPLADYGYVEARALSRPVVPRGPALSFEPVPLNGDLKISNLLPVENTQFRLQAGVSTSSAVTVYVVPKIKIRVTRDPRKPAVVTATVTFGVHRLSPTQKLAPVYFYRSATRTGSAELFGSRALAPVSGHDSRSLTATVTFSDPNPVFVSVCSHGPLVSDMGPPWLGRSCGRPTVNFG
jgi:hypothetical protein